MKKRIWISMAVILNAACSAYALFGRDKIAGLWPSGPVQIDGRAVEWSEMPLLDEHGLGFRAMNDAANLYLLIGGTAADGRLLLSGKSGQNITLWFLKSDGKTRDWGINLDFSRTQDSAVEYPTTLADWGIAAERVVPQGLEVSTTTFPAEIEFQADLSSQRGRQPVYELRIPLSMLEHKGRSLDFDFVATDMSAEVRAAFLASPAAPSVKKENQENATAAPHGGGRHHRGAAASGGSTVSADDLPKRLNLHLSVGLAKESKP